MSYCVCYPGYTCNPCETYARARQAEERRINEQRQEAIREQARRDARRGRR